MSVKKSLDKETVVLSAVVVVVVLLLGYSLYSSFSFVNIANDEGYLSDASVPITASGYDSKSVNGEVSVVLTPKRFNQGKFYVDYAIETHTFNGLDKIDLKEVVTLEYDGVTVKPSEASAMGGHHNFGTMIFDVDSEPKSFSIIVLNIPDVSERIFNWD